MTIAQSIIKYLSLLTALMDIPKMLFSEITASQIDNSGQNSTSKVKKKLFTECPVGSAIDTVRPPNKQKN